MPPISNTRFLTLVAGGIFLAVSAVFLQQFIAAKRGCFERAAATDLEFLNGALHHFAEQHDGRQPGLNAEGEVDAELLVRALTLPTGRDGAPRPDGPCSPCLPAGVPPNPWNSSCEVRVANDRDPPSADESSGWIYHVASRQFLSNAHNDRR